MSTFHALVALALLGPVFFLAGFYVGYLHPALILGKKARNGRNPR